MQFRDYYATLSVDRKASEQEIKKAYRRLARQHHPDLNPGSKEAETRFKEINEAYEVLGDADSRKKYDELGANWKQYEQAGAAPSGAGPFGAGGARRTTRTMTPEEVQELFGGQDPFSDFFHTFFDGQTDSGTRDRSGRRNRRSQSRTTRSHTGRWAADSRIDEAGESGQQIDLTLAEVLEGAERRLVIQGEGGASRTVTVKIPSGVVEGARIRVGGPAPGGEGRHADVYLRVHVLPHPTIERRGQDLHQRLLVPVTAAVLGGEVAIPALSGSTLRLKIPAGTQGGRVLRLKRHGLPSVGGADRGDLYVTIDLQIPQALTDDARRHYEALRDLDEGRTT